VAGRKAIAKTHPRVCGGERRRRVEASAWHQRATESVRSCSESVRLIQLKGAVGRRQQTRVRRRAVRMQVKLSRLKTAISQVERRGANHTFEQEADGAW
jgi:hypothetical protein